MRATLIGHACWLVETPAGNVLTDPVLEDPFEQGTVIACPAREVDLDALPALAALSNSHRHLDHFHVPTLRRLDKTLPVYCPGDELLQESLRRIGFSDLRTLRAYEPHALPGLDIVPVSRMGEVLTHALVREPEPTEWTEADQEKAAQASVSEDDATTGVVAH